MHSEPRLFVNELAFPCKKNATLLLQTYFARMILVFDLVPLMKGKLQRCVLATRTIVLILLLGVNLARRSLQPSQGSHQLGCGGVSLTRSHVYNLGFRLSLNSYCRLASPSVENLFLPVFRNSYLPNDKYEYLPQ